MMQLLFDFSQPGALAKWRSVDDVVMGGRSQSRIEATDDAALFAGELSLADGGGFASVRADGLAVNLEEFDGLRLRVRGDGKHYGVTLRAAQHEGVRFQAGFDAPAGNEWTDITLPFTSFTPKALGTPLPLGPTLPRDRITSLGLIISDKQAGPFALCVASIVAYGG